MVGRLALSVLAVIGVSGCGNWQRVGSEEEPEGSDAALAQMADLAQVYRRTGRLAAGSPLPFVGSLAYAAGPVDSSLAVLGLSLENRVLSFERAENAFIARYRVIISFRRQDGPPIVATRNEVVRVTSFQETLRNDESVIFQQAFALPPGEYDLQVTVRDLSSSRQSQATSAITVPSFGPGDFSAPIVAYEVTGRAERTNPLDIMLNPRGTVAYGSDTLLAYVEGYAMPGPTALPFTVQDQRDSVIYSDSLRFQGGAGVEGLVIRLTPDSVPLGELQLVVGAGPDPRETAAIVSLSSDWVVTNIDEIIELLRYFSHNEELAALKEASPGQRPLMWREFYAATDPVRATPENEALDTYFTRLAIANQRFDNEGIAGWRTD
ncbi:MAG: GWxTD domain-containing protein, partial [Gemmatimonadales bacterium]